MTWTVLDLKRIPPTTRCCQYCNRELVEAYSASTAHDQRIQKFAPDFLFPIVPPHSRPSSSLSMRSAISNSSTFVPISSGYKVPPDEKERLRSRLIQWRENLHAMRGSPLFFSSQIFFPPKQLNLLVSECNKYLEVPLVNARFLRKLIQWDSAGDAEWDGVSQVIMEWREDARPPATPTSQRRARKKARAPLEPPPRTPVIQPNFQALHGALPHSTAPQQLFPASNVFQTPQPATGPSYIPQKVSTTPHPRHSDTYHPQVTHCPNIFQTQSIPSPSTVTQPILSLLPPQTDPYYQLISPPPIVYPHISLWTPPFPYNQTPPGTIIYQTPTAPPSSLRFSYYNPQMPR